MALTLLVVLTFWGGVVCRSWCVSMVRCRQLLVLSVGLGFSCLRDCACALGKWLQWAAFFVFSPLSLVQQSNCQGPGLDNAFRLETSL